MIATKERETCEAQPAVARVCAWCGQRVAVAHPTTGEPAEPLSHGICPACAERLVAEFEAEQRQVPV